MAKISWPSVRVSLRTSYSYMHCEKPDSGSKYSGFPIRTSPPIVDFFDENWFNRTIETQFTQAQSIATQLGVNSLKLISVPQQFKNSRVLNSNFMNLEFSVDYEEEAGGNVN
jgi:hypothetical protein